MGLLILTFKLKKELRMSICRHVLFRRLQARMCVTVCPFAALVKHQSLRAGWERWRQRIAVYRQEEAAFRVSAPLN